MSDDSNSEMVDEGAEAPDDVGESMTKSAEDVAKTEQEAGRYDTGPDDSEVGRPTGESTPRDLTGIDPS